MSSTDTMKNWPSIIEEQFALPPDFFALVDHEVSSHWPYCVYVPSHQAGPDIQPAYVMMLLEHNLRIGILLDNCLNIKDYAYKHFHSVEKGIVLLSGWIELTCNYQGQFESLKFTYNAVKECLFNPLIERIRKESITSNHNHYQGSESDYDFLRTNSLKLYSYSNKVFRHSKPLHTIYQSKLSHTSLDFFETNAIPHSVLHMTANELIFIHEPEYTTIKRSNRGGIWKYIPLSKVSKIDIHHEPGTNMTKLNVNFFKSTSISFNFMESNEIELYKITTEFDSLRRGR